MSVSISGVGPNDNIFVQVDPTNLSLHTVAKSDEYAPTGQVKGGFYRLGANFLNTAGTFNAALSPLFAVQWNDPTRYMILKRVVISATISTVFTNAQVLDYDIIKATSYSSGPSGGSNIAPNSVSNIDRRDSMASSSLVNLGSILISGTGAQGGATGTAGTTLSPGTLTLDAQPFGYVALLSQNAAAASATQNLPTCSWPLYEHRNNGDYPMMFAANEGFLIRNVTAYGAAGVVKVGVYLEWLEAASY